jgi:hypothetical protein
VQDGPGWCPSFGFWALKLGVSAGETTKAVKMNRMVEFSGCKCFGLHHYEAKCCYLDERPSTVLRRDGNDTAESLQQVFSRGGDCLTTPNAGPWPLNVLRAPAEKAEGRLNSAA